MKWAVAPGNFTLSPKQTSLPREWVVNVSGIFRVNKSELDERVGQISARLIRRVFSGIDLVLGR